MTAETSSAVINGPYRYVLTRSWGEGPHAVWVMLNPSTADATVDDPTIRRVRGFTQRLGHHGFTVVNLYAWRSTDPKALRKVDDPVGPANDFHIGEAVRDAPIVLAAWGNLDNEAHAAEALALHAEFVDAEGPSVVWEHVEQCWPWPEPGAKHPRFKQAA